MSFIFQEDTLDSFQMDLKEEKKLGNRKKRKIAVGGLDKQRKGHGFRVD